MELELFFANYPESRAIFDRVWDAAGLVGTVELRVAKTQVTLVCIKPFAWVWIPEMHLGRRGAPLVVSLSFMERRPWSRWKEIYQAAPHRFTHHLELWSPEEVDADVQAWLRVAWEEGMKGRART